MRDFIKKLLLFLIIFIVAYCIIHFSKDLIDEYKIIYPSIVKDEISEAMYIGELIESPGFEIIDGDESSYNGIRCNGWFTFILNDKKYTYYVVYNNLTINTLPDLDHMTMTVTIDNNGQVEIYLYKPQIKDLYFESK